MYKIDSLTVTQIRIFSVDELPYPLLQMPSSVAAIRVAFNFQQVTPLAPPLVPDPQGAFMYTQGEFKDGDLTYAIQQLQLEPRRVTLISQSPSEVANREFERLRAVFSAIDSRPTRPGYQPIFATEDTSSVVKFDFAIDHLFGSGPLYDFSLSLAGKLAGFGNKVLLSPCAVRYQVLYGEMPEDLRLQGVLQLPKEVRIELRNQSKPEDQLYFVQSPNPSDKHLELLAHIDATFRGE